MKTLSFIINKTSARRLDPERTGKGNSSVKREILSEETSRIKKEQEKWKIS